MSHNQNPLADQDAASLADKIGSDLHVSKPLQPLSKQNQNQIDDHISNCKNEPESGANNNKEQQKANTSLTPDMKPIELTANATHGF